MKGFRTGHFLTDKVCAEVRVCFKNASEKLDRIDWSPTADLVGESHIPLALEGTDVGLRLACRCAFHL